jgi:hypothetical protein
MKSPRPVSFLTAVIAVAAVFFLSGCLEEHVVWAPDGSRAAVIADDGLRLCDAKGVLTPVFISDVKAAVWFSDSRQMALVREVPLSQWAEAQPFLSPERARDVAEQSEAAWRTLANDSAASLDLKERDDASLIRLYLWSHYGEALARRGGAEQKESHSVQRYELSLAKVDGGKIALGRTVHAGLEEISGVRVAPGDRTLAFITAPNSGRNRAAIPGRLYAAPLVGESVLMAEGTPVACDWTADGRSLVYVRGPARLAPEAVVVGSVCRRGATDEAGALSIASKEEELAGLILTGSIRIRCLRNGRIIFNAVELALPATVGDVKVSREGLFIIDAERQSTLVRVIPRSEEEQMPGSLSLFEVSPDERRVAVAGENGDMRVLTLSTGEIETVQEAGQYGLEAAPAWRSADELTYAKRNPRIEGKQPERKAEVVLRKGSEETVLSQSWSNEMLGKVFTAKSSSD